MGQRFSFDDLRRANLERLPLFKAGKTGKAAHSVADGSDWTPSDWFVCVLGELGEAANKWKKVVRDDWTAEQALPHIAKELADVQIYLDLLAYRLGIELGEATIDKWNEKSEELGIPLRINVFTGQTFTP